MTDHAANIYKNWGNKKYLELHASQQLISLANKIKNTSSDGPFIDSDIAAFIFELLHRSEDAHDEVDEHVSMAQRYMLKGNQQEITRLVHQLLSTRLT